MPGTLFYELSEEADTDLVEVYDYTVENFGEDQAVYYLNGIDELCEHLCLNLETGRTRNEIIEGLRSLSFENHILFYRILKDRIRIVRVLHERRDVIKFLFE